MTTKFSPNLKIMHLMLGFAVVVIGGAAQAATPLYHITDLGTAIGGFSNIDATSINNLGQVTGSGVNSSGQTHAFIYNNGSMQDIGTLGGGYIKSRGNSINDNGWVTGYSSSNNKYDAFVYDGSQIHGLIKTDADQIGSEGTSINNAGQTTGSTYGYFGSGKPDFEFGIEFEKGFIASNNNQMQDIGTLGGAFVITRSNAINNLGQVTGESYTSASGGTLHAFVYEGNQMKDIGTLGGYTSKGIAINNLGDITGESEVKQGALFSKHAFIYRNGSMQDIGTLGGSDSSGNGLNDSGAIVGTSKKINGAQAAFLYSSNIMTDLNTVLDSSGNGWLLSSATDINNTGQIIGTGFYNGHQTSFLLTEVAPVPLPGSVLLLGSGLGLFGWLKRRHQPLKVRFFNA